MQPKAAQPSAQFKRVVKARSDLLLSQPFFGFLALRLKLVEDPSCGGMWTDSVSLGFNPAYVDSLLDIELKGGISATLMHIAAGHPWRQGNRDSSVWNRACDYAIHPIVEASGFRLPRGMLSDPAYARMSAEYIYNKLLASGIALPPPGVTALAGAGAGSDGADASDGAEGNYSSAGDEGDSATGGAGTDEASAPVEPQWLGEVRPAPGGRPGLEAEWQMAMHSASQMQGDLAGCVMHLVEDALKSRVDWRSVLRNFVENSRQNPRQTFTRLNRRYQHLGFVLPGKRGASLKTMVIVTDTSGSIFQIYRRLFKGETLDIIETMKPEALYVLDVDATVQRVQTILNADDEDYDGDTRGGGGTDFRPAFDWVEQEGIDCACMLYLTDLQGTFPEHEPDYPVLWAVPEGSNRGYRPPWGEMVELTLN